MINEFKDCIVCKQTKRFDLFHKCPKKKDGRFSVCKKCAHDRLVKARNDPNKKTQFKQYQRNSGIKRRYGITTPQYDQMVIEQKNRCLICGNEPVPNGAFQSSKLHIDHCHVTGKVRGLLCHLCNRGIGLFRERIDLMKEAVRYLKKHKA